MKSAVFISSGIGNALLQIPMARELARHGDVTGIIDSTFVTEAFYFGLEGHPYTDFIEIRSPSDAIKVLVSFLKYDLVVMDYFSANLKNALIASLIGKKVVTNHPNFRSFPSPNLHHVSLQRGLHELRQQLNLIGKADRESIDIMSDLQCKPRNKSIEEKLPLQYITWQPGSGNGKTPWKTWPVKYWLELFHILGNEGFEFPIVALGDKDDFSLKAAILESELNIIDYIGKTTLQEFPAVISNSIVHMGTDSSGMHLAAATATPTFTIWGGSDPHTYGYMALDPAHHFCLCSELPCWPCNRYIAPNLSRVNHPAECPDQMCIKGISPGQAAKVLLPFLKKLGLN